MKLVRTRVSGRRSIGIWSVYRAAPFSLTTLGTVLFVNHLILTQLDSSMSLDVFLGFRRCPKHPNTPPFDFGTPIAYFGNPLPGEIGEIAKRLSGG